MADKKISELDAITGAATASDDYFIVVDSSGAVTKKISRAELNNAMEIDVLSTVNIDGGTIDGTTIGGSSAAAGTFTSLNATGGGALTGTWSNLGSVTTVDINGGTIDGTTIGGSSAAAGTFTTFTSTGIDDNASSTAITIDGSQRVGIGTPSPGYKLDVAGDAGFDNTVNIENTGGFATIEIGGTSGAYIDLKNPFSDDYDARFWSNGTDVYIENKSAGYLALKTNATERMRIDGSSGNVGIGVTPTYKLDIGGSTENIFRNTGGSVQAAVYASGGGGQAQFGTFSSHHTVLITGGTERVRINTSGYVGINTTSFPYSEQLSIKFPNTQAIHMDETTASSSVNFIYLTSNGTNVGAAYYNGSTVAWQTTSDYRLKENFRSVDNAVDLVKSLNPSRYEWRKNGRTSIGFVAHELQQVVPDAVSGKKDEVDTNGKPVYQGVDNSAVVPLLTAALKEAINKIETLEARVASLEAK